MVTNQPTLPLSILILATELRSSLEKTLESTHWAAEHIIATPKMHWPAVHQLQKKLGLQTVICVEIMHPVTDFAAERKKLLAQATQTWSLFLDSDEWFEPSAQGELQELIAQNRISGFTFRRFDVWHHQVISHGEVGQQRLLRLVKTSEATIQRPVHEVLTISSQPSAAQTIIWHTPHPTLTEFLAQVSRYAQLEAQHRQPQHKVILFWQMITYPVAKFFIAFLVHAGWRDGWAGLCYASCMSLHSLWVRVYQYEITT